MTMATLEILFKLSSKTVPKVKGRIQTGFPLSSRTAARLALVIGSLLSFGSFYGDTFFNLAL